MKNAKKKTLPKFKSEKAEAKFWQKHDSANYIDWSKAKLANFPRLRPSTKIISIRLPEELLGEIKEIAHKEDLPYQSLIKIILSEGVQQLKG